MDIGNSKGNSGFWKAYRACAEENRVASDRLPFYVNWAKTFANFLPGKPLYDSAIGMPEPIGMPEHYQYGAFS